MKIQYHPNLKLYHCLRSSLRTDWDVRRYTALCNRMMLGTGGLGLSAPQVSSAGRLVLLANESLVFVVCNPQLTRTSNLVTDLPEGCLSIPGFTGIVTRFANVLLRGVVLWGCTRYIMILVTRAKHLVGICLQHEHSHLEGRTIIRQQQLS